MSEKDFMELIRTVDLVGDDKNRSLLETLKLEFSCEEINERLLQMTFSIWDDYIKSYEYQLRAEDLQKENEILQSKLEKYYEIAGKLTMEIRALKEENEELKINKHYFQKENEMLNKCLKEFGERSLNVMKVKHGNPIAYRTDAGIGIVLALHRSGLTQKEIAENLGIGETTVYRRFKELREAGLIK